MAIDIIKQTDLAIERQKTAAEEQRIADMELFLADQLLENMELLGRVSDTELALADILVGGVL